MVNRYVAASMVAEAIEGRRILVLGVAARDAGASVTERLQVPALVEVSRVSRANGDQRIEFVSGGRIYFRSYQGHGHRGVSVDTLYLDSGLPAAINDPDMLASFRACVAASPSAEIIRA